MIPKWQRILVHHSASHDTEAMNSEAIRRYHIEERGWVDVGYHYLVENVHGVYVAVPGRSLGKPGAHCPGQNTVAIGVCLIGNFVAEAPSAAQLDKVSELCSELCLRFGIPVEEIHPHNRFRKTECPAKVPVQEIRERVQRLLTNG